LLVLSWGCSEVSELGREKADVEESWLFPAYGNIILL
jgi:hypothetical protein